MAVALNLLLMIIGFGLLIFVHELGHFLAAKWARIRTEAFAVGMGPVIFAWRRGVGVATGSTHNAVVERTGKAAHELSDDELREYGIGETEYSLRWVPVGGFVKMLGQDDADPSYRSDDPRSYNRCPIGKRLIVISAGVVMNVILAIVLFMIAFLVGVRFEAPVIGDVVSGLPAATRLPENAAQLGITAPGLQGGDRVTQINGNPARTFGDVQIASAMGRPDRTIEFTIERRGVDEPLRFHLTPRKDERTGGLMTIGVLPGSSTQLMPRDPEGQMAALLARAGLSEAGVEPGMRLIEVNGHSPTTINEVERIADASDGAPLQTTWATVSRRTGEPSGDPIEATLQTVAELQQLIHPGPEGQDRPNGEPASRLAHSGLLGFVPLVRIDETAPDSPNVGVFEPGDTIIRVALADESAPSERIVEFPYMTQLLDAISQQAGRDIKVTVLRDGEPVDCDAKVNRRGQIGVRISPDTDVLVIATPVTTVYTQNDKGERVLTPTPIAALDLLPGTRILEVAGTPVDDWTAFRETLRRATAEAHRADTDTTVEINIAHPTPSHPRETVAINLSARDVADVHALGWTTPLVPGIFEPVYTTLDSGGNPLTAVSMGFAETHKLIVLTYLTIDRLFRRTVGVDQLRGPIGIIHIGVQIADRGILYLVFLLAVVSVNLAVINFLPLPILDGGQFLLLLYEKVKGQPPSVGFQNALTLAGLMIIGTLFVVVTYHDVMRLVGG